ncbi:hypothetical protein RND81_03G043300 [Saponaria officinalis]|uniref:K Homology domain-containing protein n=1 Tax=Saponaria officinalis TaxID=3572 RepID=A0AAW1LYA2_SAPOF
MSLSLTPSKRQHSHNSKESNGKKFQKTLNFDSPKEPRISTSAGDVFRVLCSSSKIESIAGQVENIISQIRQETGAVIRIDDPIPGCDERVIFIMGPDKETQNSKEQSNIDDKESKATKDQVNSVDHGLNANDTKQEALSAAGDTQSNKGTGSVQRALLLVLEKFVEGDRQTDVSNEESNGSATVTFRLLVLSSQVGCLLGRGGSIIKQMATESGAQIRVLPRDKLPQCASSADDVVQIVGVGDAVKKAIKSVSDQIMENANAEHDVTPNLSAPASQSRSQPVSRSESNFTRPKPFRGAPSSSGFREDDDIHPNVPPFFPKFQGNIMPGQIDVSDIVTFRLLCPDERVGGLIGKGGAIIKTLMHETGCDIKVLEGVYEGEERIVVVSGPAHPDDKLSVVQDAVLRILNRIAKPISDSKEKGITAKFLVHSNQIGCLLGKGGSVIAEMRKVTGAFISILGKDQLPKSSSEDEEVVQVNGEVEVVQEAVLQITTRLQHRFFRDAFPSAFADRPPPFASYMGRREHSPKFGPSFRTFDPIAGPPFNTGLHPHDDLPPFMRDVNRHGISERPWPPQTLIESGPNGLLDYGGPHRSRMFGFGGESQQAFITNTTIEVVVPSSLIPSICGEDGGCLRQIRQISDARIIIDDPRPGVPETLIIISGTPEQTHAAQSLIQAFVMLESESSR